MALQFLVFAAFVVAASMVVLGALVSNIVSQGIANGIADTAAASLETFIAHSIDFEGNKPLTQAEQQAVDRLLVIVGEAQSTRLVDVRLWQPDGTSLYQSDMTLIDGGDSAAFQAAAAGTPTNAIVSVNLPPAGPVQSLPLRLLRIYAPIRDDTTQKVVAVAAFYFGTRALAAQQSAAQAYVWLAVLGVGLFVVAVLYAFVQTIGLRLAQQDERLLDNLKASNALAEQNRVLREESEKLRLEAIEANEALLARVGADIHDGPLQVLTLIQMRLSRLIDVKIPADLLELVRRTMEELRALSVGLVLPELDGASLGQTIEMAANLHEALSGTRVARDLRDVDIAVAPAIRTSVYRIVQQSLSNATQHADGKDQSVTAMIANDQLLIAIASGAKSPRSSEENRPRLGLRGMRLRAEAAGGHLRVRFEESATVVEFTLPVGALQ